MLQPTAGFLAGQASGGYSPVSRHRNRERPAMDATTIDRLGDAHVLVVGDVLLDRFVHGNAARISREAPVPVLGDGPTDSHPGGACNVATNVLSCGGQATLIGLVGDDPVADELLALCRSFDGMTADFVTDPSRPTTLKTRYMSGWHQLLCVDTEVRTPCTDVMHAALLSAVEKALPHAGTLVISDYGRGALRKDTIAALIALGRAAGVPTIVDPRHDRPEVYDGATLVTPNLGEMEKFTGIRVRDDESAIAACRAVLERARLDAVLVTRGADGMTLVNSDTSVAPLHIGAETQEVFDVTGAGDTVVAIVSAALAGGVDMADAVRLANTAAGIVVAKPGTAVVHPRELREKIAAVRHENAVPWKEAAEIVSLWKSLGLKAGFTNGVFDLLHRGHLHSLEQAAARCDRLVVGVNADASVKRLKGPSRPVHDEETRAAVLAALRVVDLVVVFGEDTPEKLVRTIRPDRLFKGADYEGQEVPGGAFVKANGGEVAFLPLLDGFSTTGTIRQIEGD